MEPFGLFQFLQSLLNSPSDSATPPTEENATADPASHAKNNDTPNEQVSDKQPSSFETANGEAYLRFISDHEKRARKTKK